MTFEELKALVRSEYELTKNEAELDENGVDCNAAAQAASEYIQGELTMRQVMDMAVSSSVCELEVASSYISMWIEEPETATIAQLCGIALLYLLEKDLGSVA